MLTDKINAALRIVNKIWY